MKTLIGIALPLREQQHRDGTPLGEQRSQAVLARLAELAPGKRSGPWWRRTITTITQVGFARTSRAAPRSSPPQQPRFLGKLATTPHTIKPDSQSRAKASPVIEVIAGKKQLGDAAHPVELYDVGPSPHVDEMLVAYLPRDKILFVRDLFTIPPQGRSRRARPPTASSRTS